MSENRFIQNMKSYGLGSTLARMAQYQEEIRHAVNNTGKQGKLVLTLTYKKKGQHVMQVLSEVKPTIPIESLPTVDMFDHPEKGLFEEDPDQLNHDNVVVPDFKKAQANDND